MIQRCISLELDVKIISNGQNNLRDSVLLTDNLIARTVFLLKKPIWFPFKGFSLRALWFIFWALFASINTFKLLVAEKRHSNKKALFVVHGDTVSTLIGSTVARLLGYFIVHVESGLSSGALFNPFPEEICRRIVTRISNLRLCPTEQALANVRDGVNKRKQLTFGNTMWDMLTYGLQQSKAKARDPYFLLIIHRQETLANPTLFFSIIEKVIKARPKDLACLFILHGPTKNFILAHGKHQELANTNGWQLIDRLPFFDFAQLLNGAQFVLTDGGTNQEECYYLGLPCYLLRDCTERNEGLGQNVVLNEDFVSGIPWFIENFHQYRRDKVNFEKSPSQIIAEEIFRESSGH